MRERMQARVIRVQKEFGVLDHQVVLDRLPQWVVREETTLGTFKLFRERIVGMDPDPKLRVRKVIRIVHSKDELSLEDLRHEFCHFTHPDWSEEQVRAATDRRRTSLAAT